MDWLRNTKRSRLSNGLTVLTNEQPHSSAAALHFCVKAGYFCETDEEVGLAHLLEHMYFKGSEKFPHPGTIGIRLKELGGMVNASTSYDQTNYYCEVPAANILPALEIMADAFASPTFPHDELRKECEVVIEEFNRKLDSPIACSVEKLLQLGYTTHRMKRWRIGTPEQLRSFSRENLFDFFHRYYQPQNMILTMTGKFDSDLLLQEAERLMAGMKNQELKKDFGPAEPRQHELRYSLYQAVSTQSYLHFGFHVPGVFQPENPALEFLSFLLSAGRSSRLHRHLVEQKRSATSASCSYLAHEDIGFLILSCVTEKDKIRECGRNLWEVISDLMEHGITEDEMQKVRNKLLLHQSMQAEDILNLAELLSYYEAYGGFEKIETFLDEMKRMETSQVLQVAEKYLTGRNLSVLEFVNESLDPVSGREYETHLQSRVPAPEFALPPPLTIQYEDSLGSPLAVESPIIHRGEIDYILQPDPMYPFIACGIYFTGGRNEECNENSGITNLLFRSVLKGTDRWDTEQIASRFDFLGNPPRFNCFRDYGGFSFECLPHAFLPVLDLLLHCIENAQFPETEIGTEKSKMISAIRRNLDDNFVRPIHLLQRAYYRDHPYGMPETGTEQSLSPIQREDLLKWKERLMNKGRMVIAAVGNFDHARLIELFDSKLKHFRDVNSPFVQPTTLQIPASRIESEDRQKKQTAFALGFPAPTALHPDIHKYEVTQQILSGMGGRLFLNLRSKKSLAYTVYAAAVAGLYSGMFVTYLAGEASKENEAREAMWYELKQLTEEPVRREEIENARNSLFGAYVLNTQTASSKIGDYISCFIAKRPIPYLPAFRDLVRTVSPEDILMIAQRSFLEENSAIGIVRGTTMKTDSEKLIGV